MDESPIEEIIMAIINEINGCGLNLGYRAMHQRLRDKYNLNVKQKQVLRLQKIIDPIGVDERSKYRLKRRLYRVPGPNHLWHVDGYDRLKRFGFAIHGCVDCYSRKVIWLECSTTDNKPEVIGYYYLQAVKEFKLIPSVIRSDNGTENTLIDLLQIGLRYEHQDEYAAFNSFRKGKSTVNERIEKHWCQIRNHRLLH